MALRIMLLGYGRAGKGTFCILAKKVKNMSSIASSMMACQLFLYDELKDKYGYASPEACYADRLNHRQVWYEAIQQFNTPDKTALGNEIFKRYSIYDGCRDKAEFDALKAGGYFDIAVWIDGGERIEPESKASMTVTRDDADIIIMNDTVESEYLDKVAVFLDVISR